MFQNPKTVARVSIIGGLINTACAARLFFVHEYAVGTWLALMATVMVLQFYVADGEATSADGDPPRTP
jgi:hypothetical protein